MKRKSASLLLILWIVSISCALPALPFSPLATPTSTQTPMPLPTITPQPSPTPIPTPLPEVRIERAEQFIFAGDYDNALMEYQSVLVSSTSPDEKIAAQIGIGRIEYLKGDYENAVVTFTKVIDGYDQNPLRIKAYFYLGMIYSNQNQPSEAVRAFDAYLNLRPGVIDAYVEELRGDALALSGNYTEAISAYTRSSQAQRLSDPIYLEINIGKMYTAMGDDTNALRTFLSIYDKTTNDYLKAQMNLFSGQAYVRMGLPEQAHARYQDSVNNYPLAYDSYTALVELVNAGIPVDELSRGLVDYYAGQYGVAIEAFNRYIASNPERDGTAHHYKALSARAIGDYAEAISEWNILISKFPGDRFFTTAYKEKAYTQWAYIEQYSQAAQTLQEFVRLYPTAPDSPDLLFESARILERSNRLTEASAAWERLINEYPSSPNSYRALFLSGITQYRLGKFDQSLVIFQRVLVLSSSPGDLAAAYLWIGKSQQAKNDINAAKTAWQMAAAADPTGYYSERALELLTNTPPFSVSEAINLDINLEQERHLAELWMKTNFTLQDDTDLNSLGPLAQDPRIIRGNEFWSLGLYAEARAEFESVRQDVQQDASNTFRLLNHLEDIGFYRSAVFASRQVLTLAGMNDADTFTAPNYFNHIRFGTYYRDIVEPAALEEGFSPLFLFAVIRQESLFEGFVQSSAGARGLMQIMPATGDEIVSLLKWPAGYTTNDLYRPVINIRLGARYLARMRNLFGGDLYAMLAAYNAGPGNAQYWKDLAPNDPDLLLEVIRYEETRTYIIHIMEFLQIYKRLYEIPR